VVRLRRRSKCSGVVFTVPLRKLAARRGASLWAGEEVLRIDPMDYVVEIVRFAFIEMFGFRRSVRPFCKQSHAVARCAGDCSAAASLSIARHPSPRVNHGGCRLMHEYLLSRMVVMSARQSCSIRIHLRTRGLTNDGAQSLADRESRHPKRRHGGHRPADLRSLECPRCGSEWFACNAVIDWLS
jgi:hypothetical protein